MAKQSLISEIYSFIKQEKKFWMIPLIVLLLVIGGLLVLASTSPTLAPFVYPLL